VSATPVVTSNAPAVAGELVLAGYTWNAAASAVTNPTNPPFLTPFDTIFTQLTAQCGGGSIVNTGAGAITYAPTLNHTPTSSAVMLIAFKPLVAFNIGWAAVAQFQASHTYAAGALIRQLTPPAVGSERVFVCIVAGTSGTEPTWTVTRGAKNTSTTPVFQECTGQAGVNGDLTNCPNWTKVKQANVTLGQVIQNVAGTFLFICSTAGTGSSSTEPAWTLTAGATKTDNTVTWTCLGAVGNFGAWASPHARLANACATNWGLNAAQTFFVADNHAEASSAAITWKTAGQLGTPCYVLCVDHTASVPPGSANLETGASISSSFSLLTSVVGVETSANGTVVYYYGLTFAATASGPGSDAVVSVGSTVTNDSVIKLENCALSAAGALNLAQILCGDTSSTKSNSTELVNTTIALAGISSSGVGIYGGTFVWRNTPNAVTIPSGSVPGLFFSQQGKQADALIEGVDLSNAGISQLLATSSQSIYLALKDCKIPSGVVVAPLTSSINNSQLDLINCDSGGTNYRNERHSVGGDQTTATTVYRASGYAIEGTSLSWQIVTPSTNVWWSPFLAQPILIRNGLTGSSRSVTLYGIANAAAVPNNDQFWFDVEYMASGSSPLGSYASGTKANVLASGSALTADTSAWDGGASARQNSHAYSIGAVIKLASNPGRLFFCIASSGGSSAGSEPGGYASAVDGGSVTDGTVTFRAGCRFKQTVTLTAQQAGLLTLYPKMAAVSTTLFLDPLPVLA
jgi:hypothetical protein